MRLTVLFLLFCLNGYSQFKKEIPSYVATYLAGALDGTSETIKWHYYEFEEAFPKANPNFWNPKYSSQNKYKDGITSHGPKFFGSTTFLVWTTDGYHLVNMGRNVALITTLIIHPREKKSFKAHLKDLLIHSAIYQAGFYTTYEIAFRSRLLR